MSERTPAGYMQTLPSNKQNSNQNGEDQAQSSSYRRTSSRRRGRRDGGGCRGGWLPAWHRSGWGPGRPAVVRPTLPARVAARRTVYAAHQMVGGTTPEVATVALAPLAGRRCSHHVAGAARGVGDCASTERVAAAARRGGRAGRPVSRCRGRTLRRRHKREDVHLRTTLTCSTSTHGPRNL